MEKNQPTSQQWWECAETAKTAIIDDPKTFTGLYNADGVPLHRKTEPFGFNPNRWNTDK
jgi:hypothetical protein